MDNKGLIVISAINIREGGPLTILNHCLKDLTSSYLSDKFKILALVHRKDLCYFDGVTYIEFPKSNKRVNYFYNEYFGLRRKIEYNKIDLLLSLTDKTPNINADLKAVYIHNPTPFFEVELNDFIKRPFLVLYKYFYAKLCAINVHSNRYVIVQQNWLRTSFSKLLSFPESKIIVFPPAIAGSFNSNIDSKKNIEKCKTFIFPSLPRSFKNFEIICEAVKILNDKGQQGFKVILTLGGSENKYSKGIFEKYKKLECIQFLGVIPHEELLNIYKEVDCLIFPSRLETWGLAISEFSALNKPLLLADLPYARNTAQGSMKTSFFNVRKPDELAKMMTSLINGDHSFLHSVPKKDPNPPFTTSWLQTVNFLLQKNE